MNKTITGIILSGALVVGGIVTVQVTDTAPLVDCKEMNCVVQVKIKEQTEYGEYSDAIYFTPSEWEKTTKEDVNTETQRRIDNRREAILSAPVPQPPTEEELIKLREELDVTIQSLQNQRRDVETQINEKRRIN